MRRGVLDMLPHEVPKHVTPFQRIMQTGWVAAIYEKQWRRMGYYLASSRSFQSEITTVLDYVGKSAGNPLLDLACGPGVFTRPLAMQTEGLVIGLDLSWPMLRQASLMMAQYRLSNVFLIRGTVFRLPFLTGVFPRIVCCGALHLFDQPDAALKEIDRVAGPRGQLCVQTTIRPGHSAGVIYLLERFIRFGFFTEKELEKKLSAHAFRILKQERHRISYTFLAEHIL
jgi:ubiquinone/menaquinone biosynthesis C-methylase UbiE